MAPSNNRTQYINTPLNSLKAQIRVAHLQPGSANEEINCILEVINLDQASKTQYDALSYEWGDANTSQSIMLNGLKFAVRINLWWALWHLRDEKQSVAIWIDALCIDQDNMSERNHQVQQMGTIYSQATKVIAWLGVEHQDPTNTTSSPDISQAVSLIVAIHYSITHGRRPWKDSQIWQHPGWNSLLSILFRSYWARLWIIQELVLANDIEIRCGKEIIRWECLQKTLQSVQYERSFEFRDRFRSTQASKILKDRTERANFKSKLSPSNTFGEKATLASTEDNRGGIYQFFQTYSESKCFDIRDKIYGHFALAPRCCQQEIGIDYQKSAHEIGKLMVEHEIKAHHRDERLTHGRLYRMIRTAQRSALLDEDAVEKLPFGKVERRVVKGALLGLPCKFAGDIVAVKGLIRGVTMWSVCYLKKCETDEDIDPYHEIMVWTPSTVRLGDTVYQMDSHNFFVLRSGDGGLQVVGWAMVPQVVDATGNFVWSTQLTGVRPRRIEGDKHMFYLDFSAICCFCRIFLHLADEFEYTNILASERTY